MNKEFKEHIKNTFYPENIDDYKELDWIEESYKYDFPISGKEICENKHIYENPFQQALALKKVGEYIIKDSLNEWEDFKYILELEKSPYYRMYGMIFTKVFSHSFGLLQSFGDEFVKEVDTIAPDLKEKNFYFWIFDTFSLDEIFPKEADRDERKQYIKMFGDKIHLYDKAVELSHEYFCKKDSLPFEGYDPQPFLDSIEKIKTECGINIDISNPDQWAYSKVDGTKWKEL